MLSVILPTYTYRLRYNKNITEIDYESTSNNECFVTWQSINMSGDDYTTDYELFITILPPIDGNISEIVANYSSAISNSIIKYNNTETIVNVTDVSVRSSDNRMFIIIKITI